MVIDVAGCTELSARGASVATRCDDGLRGRMEVRTQEGLHAAHAGARLVRQAVLDASAQGLGTVEMTLDVASPLSGAVLSQLRSLVDHGVSHLQVRRAGGSVLVDARLAAFPTATERTESSHPGTHSGRPDLEAVRQAHRRLQAALAGRAGVSGVGLARSGDGYVLRVEVADAGVEVPSRVDGVCVEVHTAGPVTAVGCSPR